MKPEHRDISIKVFKFAYLKTGVMPAILLSRSRTPIVVQARALAAILMRGCGMSLGEVADALHLQSRSSVSELVETYRERTLIIKDVEAFGKIESRFKASQVFGNSSKNKETVIGGAR